MFENVRNQNSIRGIYLSDLFISRVEVVLADVYVYATIVNAADKIMHTGAQIRAILQEYRRPVTINQQRCEPLSLSSPISPTNHSRLFHLRRSLIFSFVAPASQSLHIYVFLECIIEIIIPIIYKFHFACHSFFFLNKRN